MSDAGSDDMRNRIANPFELEGDYGDLHRIFVQMMLGKRCVSEADAIEFLADKLGRFESSSWPRRSIKLS